MLLPTASRDSSHDCDSQSSGKGRVRGRGGGAVDGRMGEGTIDRHACVLIRTSSSMLGRMLPPEGLAAAAAAAAAVSQARVHCKRSGSVPLGETGQV